MAREVDIGTAQPADLTDAETEAIQQGEDGVICRAALAGPGLIGQRRREIEQAASGGGVEQIRQASIGDPTGCGPQGRPGQDLMQDEPGRRSTPRSSL
jgi:hypothetical protein